MAYSRPLSEEEPVIDSLSLGLSLYCNHDSRFCFVPSPFTCSILFTHFILCNESIHLKTKEGKKHGN